MKLYIKNMVCHRCVLAISRELEEIGAEVKRIDLGEVELEKELESAQADNFRNNIALLGFELIDDKRSALIEKVKNTIIALVRDTGSARLKNYSALIEEKLKKDYRTVSGLFSEVEGTTIEQYIIAQKVELIKELLVYDELSIGGIADRLGYSSAAHLGNQFKKVTGLSPGHFKKLGNSKRLPLDGVK